MKKVVIILIVLCLLAMPTYAGFATWWYEGGAGEEYSIGLSSYGVYSLNYPTGYNLTISNYTSCDLPASDFTPVATFFDSSLMSKIILTSGTSVFVYSQDCDLEQEIQLGCTINAMPQLPFHESSELGNTQGLLLVCSTEGYEYRYSSESNQFYLYQTYNLSEMANIHSVVCPLGLGVSGDCLETNVLLASLGLRTLDCTFDGVCVGFNSSTGAPNLITNKNQSIIFRIGQGTTEIRDVALTGNFDAHGSRRYGDSASQFRWKVGGYLDDIWIPVCMDSARWGDDGDIITCAIIHGLDYDFGDVGTLYDVIEIPVHDTAKLQTYSGYFKAWYGKIGGSLKLFVAGVYQDRVGVGSLKYQQEHWIIDPFSQNIDYDHRIEKQTNSEYQQYLANWVVADVDKDGKNEAFYLECLDIATCTNVSLRFVDDDFNSYNITHDANITFNKIAVADFIPSEDWMQILSWTGIHAFDFDGENLSLRRVWDSGKSGIVTGYPIIFMRQEGYSITGVVTDLNYNGFVISADFDIAYCGNGVCDVFENAFVCPEDCNVNYTSERGTGVGCEEDSDCDSGFCENGFCRLGIAGESCTSDGDCLSGICSNGKCTNAGLWENIDQTKTSMYGNSSKTNNFISLLLIVGTPLGIIASHPSLPAIVLGGLIGAGLMVFFTLVGWLSPFITFLMVIGGIIAGVVAVVVGFGGAD